MRQFVRATLILALTGSAAADTLFLKDGVQVDGTVTKRPDGILEVKVDTSVVFYREDEIERIEQNDKTGAYDDAAMLAQLAEEEARLTAETGLTTEQRQRIEDYLIQLRSHDGADRRPAREGLVTMQAEMDVFGYLEYRLPSMVPLTMPVVMEVLVSLDGPRSVPLLRKLIGHAYYGVRGKSMELLAGLQDKDSLGQIYRGLVDIRREVQIEAVNAVAKLGAAEATPALIELLAHPDLRVSNASRNALKYIWESSLGEQKLTTVDEWQSFWSGRALPGALALNQLTPLVEQKEEFVHE